MKTLKMLLALMIVMMYWNLAFAQNTIFWDFEDGEDHGFTLRCQIPATPAPDDPDVAGDESITGIYGEDGLPGAGVAWTIGPPDMFDGLEPAVFEESDCHIVDNFLQYGPCNDPFGAAVGDPPYDFTNSRGQSDYLGTYQLNQWGDNLHSATNDQIATSPTVLLGDGAELTVWGVGNTTASWAGTRIAPEFDPDPAEGYATGSGGIAVLSAADCSLLASLLVAAEGVNNISVDSTKMPDEFNLDLSAFAGQEVIIEVVDAFEGGWGWLAIDEIQITNATELSTSVENNTTLANKFHLAQNYPNPFNPTTKINYSVPRSSFVTLKVYNSLGQEITTLFKGFRQPGNYTATFDGSGLPSGIYLYRMEAENFSDIKRTLLLK